MKRVVLVVFLAFLLFPAVALAGNVSGVRAGVTCHDPCDDPFQLKAWVMGDGAGVRVKFVVNGRVFTATCDGNGYAHYHLRVSPSSYPQGVVVKVKAVVSHNGHTFTASTWFKPNYN
jgi:hypothetical protein